jgi:Ras-related protein Rab-8A
MDAKKREHFIKLIIVGDAGVGKTNIMMRYCEGTFKESYMTTIGVDFKIKRVEVSNEKIKYQIWDTAGQERYRNITQAYYNAAAGIVLVYSVSDEKSFQHLGRCQTILEKWMKQIHEHAPKNVTTILVGNKSDVAEEEREVQYLEGKTLADKFQLPFFEVSAKNGHYIDEIFTSMSNSLIKNYIPFYSKKNSKQLLRCQHNCGKNKKKQCAC